jgi:RNA polymerase sigma-70 factor (ECF subfamily)
MAEPHRDNIGDVTLLLRSLSSESHDRAGELMEAVYDELRRLAAAHMRDEHPNITIQPTAIVHEVYLKLREQHSAVWTDRLHFFAFASQLIRRILVDQARARNAQKRGGGAKRLSLDAAGSLVTDDVVDLTDLDEALSELARLNERQARVVELRFFGGCSPDQVAELLGVARRTADRDWGVAKAWLFDRLRPDAREGADPPDA